MLASLTSAQRRWLGAMAVERGLPRTALAKLGEEREIAAWVSAGLREGLLVEPSPAELAVHPDFEQPSLRELAASHALEALALETAALLEGRSVADITVALQRGDLQAFSRHVAIRRLPRARPLPSAQTWLRESICSPFDAEWFVRAWGSRAMEVALRVLGESLHGLKPCAELADWMLAHLDEAGDRALVERRLAEHFILRGDTAPIERFECGPGHRAAARFVDGDFQGAQTLLDFFLRLGTGERGALGEIAPILALIAASRDSDAARTTAKSLLASGAARSFRLLLRYLANPSAEHRRIDVNSYTADTGAWELLLAGFTVHLHLQQPWSRASWSREITRRAIEWRDAGYLWIARQALLLAQALDEEYSLRELAARGAQLNTFTPALDDRLQLWTVLTPKPEWQKALDALGAVSRLASSQSDRIQRVAWFVDMTDGSFRRPALQEHRAGIGFGQGQRMTIAELWTYREDLPPEDQRVLSCSRELREGVRELTPEAHEMLIGHPRVFDGARGMAAVEVVRGTCRIETAEEAGYIRVIVEPAGARLGVNVVCEGDQRMVVYRVTPIMQRVIEALPQGVRIPKAHESEVIRVLGQLEGTIEVRSPHVGAESEIEPDPTPCLRIAPKAGAWSVQVGVRPFGSLGRFFVAGTGRVNLSLLREGRRLRCERDHEVERANVEQLIAACPSLAKEERTDDLFFFDESGVLSLLADLRAIELPFHVEWPESPALYVMGIVNQRTLRVQVSRLRTRKGWYLAKGSVRVDDVNELALTDLLSAPALDHGRFLRMPNGDYVEVEEKIRAVVTALAAHARGKKEIELHPAAIETLRVMVDNAFDVDSSALEWLQRFDAPSTPPEVPETLQATLRPYQIEGFRWLARLADLGLGACLADDMGLGKTLQIIALLLLRVDKGPALVVAPTSVCGNWVRELARFAPTLNVVEFAGEDFATPSAGTIVVCSYALLQQNVELLSSIAFDTAVLDEAQFIKNAESLRARAAYRLQATQRIAATGTPVENHYGDIWSIFQFLNPGLLGDWQPFKRRFVNPLESGSQQSEVPEVTLRKLLDPYVLRRRKSEVLTELPPITEVQHDVQLGEHDALRYAVLRKQIHDKLFTAHGRRHSKLQILAELTRLRRFCCHPRLVFPDAENESAKIDAFIELAEELRENGHRALVFSQYVDFLALVREQLDERGIRYEYLDGSTPKKQRPGRVDAFQTGDASFFLISLKAGGFGLNLTAADYVIHLDPWWNPAVEAQATDRAHRIGQARRVTVYRLVTKDTIEEDIVRLHQKKQRLSRALLDDGANPSDDDLTELLSLEGP